jgi:hypothetical protein
MGYQNMNDNSQENFNEKNNSATPQRTKETARLAQDTSKCQYERLSATGKAEGSI